MYAKVQKYKFLTHEPIAARCVFRRTAHFSVHKPHLDKHKNQTKTQREKYNRIRDKPVEVKLNFLKF